MAKLSEILGRDVVSRSDGSVVGRIEDVYFDEFCKNIRFLRLVCNGDEYLLPIGSVASFSDAVMVEDGVSLLRPQDADITATVGSVKGRKVFTASGKSRGEVTDASFAASGRVSAIATDDRQRGSLRRGRSFRKQRQTTKCTYWTPLPPRKARGTPRPPPRCPPHPHSHKLIHPRSRRRIRLRVRRRRRKALRCAPRAPSPKTRCMSATRKTG